MIYTKIFELIGNTPMIEFQNFKQNNNIKANIYCKLEGRNPTGSVKDRIALYMIERAQEDEIINKNTTIIEPTSGNTGIGLASVCASKGLKLILTMPDSMSIERRKLLSAYGAEIVLTDGSKGMQGAVDKANELAKSYANSFIPSQFDNPNNPYIHYITTGKEIWEDTRGNIDIFIATFGTGGTLSGVAKYLKEKNPNIKIIAVEPKDSPLLSKGVSGAHKIQGIGANFIPSILDKSLIDEIVLVDHADAFAISKEIAGTEGYLMGISAGACLFVAKQIASRHEFYGKTIVGIMPDSGDRYISTGIFD